MMKPREIDSLLLLDKPAQARFWAKVAIGKKAECWLWQGGTTTAHGHSYGVWEWQGRPYKVHRIGYTLKVGPIPEGLTLDHVRARGCVSKLCCNPAHLEPVTIEVNVKRGARELCSCGAPRGTKGRRCADCTRRYYREYRKKNPELCRNIAKASYERIGRETKKAWAERMK